MNIEFFLLIHNSYLDAGLCSISLQWVNSMRYHLFLFFRLLRNFSKRLSPNFASNITRIYVNQLIPYYSEITWKPMFF